jgi:hypothetical protein
MKYNQLKRFSKVIHKVSKNGHIYEIVGYT